MTAFKSLLALSAWAKAAFQNGSADPLVMQTMQHILDDALKQEPRNCDIYQTADEAHDAHERFRKDWIDGKYGYTGREPPWFGEWIMALATKKWGS